MKDTKKTYTKAEIKEINRQIKLLPRGTKKKIADACNLEKQYVSNVFSGIYPGHRSSVIRILEWAELFIKEAND